MRPAQPFLDNLFAIPDRLHGLGFLKEAVLLRECGKRSIRRKGQSQFKPMRCWRRYCSGCGIIKAIVTRNGYKERVARIWGPGSAAFFLTFTPPFVDDEPRLAACIVNFFRSFTGDSWWKGAKGAKNFVAVITVLEFGESNGHPHLHVFVVGPAKLAESVALRLQMRWMKRYPEAHDHAQDFQGPITHPEDIQRCLAYLTKGCTIQAGWSDLAIRGAMFMLTKGRRTITASGMGMRGKVAAFPTEFVSIPAGD